MFHLKANKQFLASEVTGSRQPLFRHWRQNTWLDFVFVFASVFVFNFVFVFAIFKGTLQQLKGSKHFFSAEAKTLGGETLGELTRQCTVYQCIPVYPTVSHCIPLYPIPTRPKCARIQLFKGELSQKVATKSDKMLPLVETTDKTCQLIQLLSL